MLGDMLANSVKRAKLIFNIDRFYRKLVIFSPLNEDLGRNLMGLSFFNFHFVL